MDTGGEEKVDRGGEGGAELRHLLLRLGDGGRRRRLAEQCARSEFGEVRVGLAGGGRSWGSGVDGGVGG